jgi:phage terminase large subunit
LSSSRAQFPEALEFLFRPMRYKVAHGGRGSAKSWGFARALLILGAQRPLRILCTREIQKSIKDSVHALLSDQIRLLGLESVYEALQQEVRGFNGTQFLFAGLSDLTAESIKSFEGVDIVWCEEARSITKRSWNILIPTIRKPGSEIWATFNPELDTDDTWQRFVVSPPPNSVVVQMNWRDNPWFGEPLASERQHAYEKAEASGDFEDYNNIWEGQCRSVVEGAIYKNEVPALLMGKRFRPVPYDPLLKVHTVWDLGFNDQTAILLVQRLGAEIRVIEYLEDSGLSIPEWAAELNKRKYNWGTDWLPHDAKAVRQQTGKSDSEVLRKFRASVGDVPEIGVEPGIKAARALFPRVYIDSDRAAGILDRLKRYRRRINQQTQQPEAPLHDENSHGADAFRYLAVIADRMSNEDDMKPLKYNDGWIV